MSVDKREKRKGVKQFAMLPLELLMHQSVTSLDHGAFRVMALLAAQYRGRNNGALGLTARQAKSAGIGSDNTLYRALRALAARRLVEQTHPASRVPPRPAMYALTWRPVDDTNYSKATRVPAHSYREWRP